MKLRTPREDLLGNVFAMKASLVLLPVLAIVFAVKGVSNWRYYALLGGLEIVLFFFLFFVLPRMQDLGRRLRGEE